MLEFHGIRRFKKKPHFCFFLASLVRMNWIELWSFRMMWMLSFTSNVLLQSVTTYFKQSTGRESWHHKISTLINSLIWNRIVSHTSESVYTKNIRRRSSLSSYAVHWHHTPLNAVSRTASRLYTTRPEKITVTADWPLSIFPLSSWQYRPQLHFSSINHFTSPE